MTILDFLLSLWADIIGIFAPYGTGPVAAKKPEITLHNTLSGEKEPFETLKDTQVKMYHCGPTVYGEQHIGNLSMYVFTDILRRTLEDADYAVKQVINITDVGHLVSDGDDGEDKMTKGLKREKKALTLENMKWLAEKYAALFLENLATLNIKTIGTQFPRASEFIPAQIAMIKTLEEKGYAYTGKSGVYFDASRFPAYGKLGNINLEGLQEGARIGINEEKRHPTDFLLWKFDRKLGWESPWGLGFPGWHIECSAMIRAILGEQIDIHTGGIEHIPVHHNNEIAQSESATGRKPMSRFWMHRAHLQIESAKIAKSTGNTVYLRDIVEKGFHPLSFRYSLLNAHYRQPANFTWESLGAAQKAYFKLQKLVDELPKGGTLFPTPYGERFKERMRDDLDTPGALAVLWEMIGNSDVDKANVRFGILEADKVLGLRLGNPDEMVREMYRKELGSIVDASEIPAEIQDLLKKRNTARAQKDWPAADAARAEIESRGYVIEDTAEGPRIVAKQ